MTVAPDLFEGGTDFAIAADRLFDSSLSDFYQRAGIDKRAQGYVKRTALRDLLHDAETDLHAPLGSLTGVPAIPTFKTAFLRELNRRPRNILRPFLPEYLVTPERINTLVDAVDNFASSGPSTVLGQMESTLDLLDDFESQAESFGTSYATSILAPLARSLRAIVEDHFDKSPYSRAANLRVETVEKKYPLHAEGETINLAFALRNDGPGYAFDVSAEVDLLGDLRPLEQSERFLGRLGVETLVFEVACEVTKAAAVDFGVVTVRWLNHDGTSGTVSEELEIAGQAQQVDWQVLQYEEPYSTEPIAERAGLVGRDDVLDDLTRRVTLRSVGSSSVTGQKRVGKTSVVRTLQSQLREDDAGIHTVFLETGEFIQEAAPATVSALGQRLCNLVASLDPAYRAVPIPAFDSALSPLASYLADIQALDPSFRCLFILDEIDELPVDVYRKGPLGTAVFSTIRSISGKAGLGFILVGGENLMFIHNEQGQLLNKFVHVRLTYFDRERWPDFEALVRTPTKDWLEISDEAVALLWEQTAGNPFFAKLLCRELFSLMVARRDSHVTEKEVQESVMRTLRETGAPAFQHFWEDGLSPFEDLTDQVILRKRIFLTLGSRVSEHGATPREALLKDVLSRYPELELGRLEAEIDDLIRREVLTAHDGSLACKVPLFREWLAVSGTREILQTLPELRAAEEVRLEEEDAVVQPEEIVGLLEGWGTYKGQAITEDRVRSWLRQFGATVNQRLAFTLLQGVKFYSTGLVREKLREAHSIVVRGTRSRVSGERVRRDILVSHLGGVGKSSAQYARLYADENRIAKDNVVSPENIPAALKSKHCQSLVFVDDFIGTGKTARRSIREIVENFGPEIESSPVSVHVIALTGFNRGSRLVENTLADIAESWELNICDPIDESQGPFAEGSTIFVDVEERERARRLIEECGRRSLPKTPLGFGDCAALVVFDSSCPNNSLPVLWASESETWLPLFRRS